MRTRADSGHRAATNLLIAGAGGLWLAAQFLPAFTDPGHPVADRSEYGWFATAFGWLAPLYLGSAGVLLFAGWTANLWFLGAVVARLAHRGRFGVLAVMALVAAAVGVWAVVSMIHTAQMGPGTWLWLGAMVLLACAAAVGHDRERA